MAADLIIPVDMSDTEVHFVSQFFLFSLPLASCLDSNPDKQIEVSIGLDKSGYQVNSFLISQ